MAGAADHNDGGPALVVEVRAGRYDAIVWRGAPDAPGRNCRLGVRLNTMETAP